MKFQFGQFKIVWFLTWCTVLAFPLTVYAQEIISEIAGETIEIIEPEDTEKDRQLMEQEGAVYDDSGEEIEDAGPAKGDAGETSQEIDIEHIQSFLAEDMLLAPDQKEMLEAYTKNINVDQADAFELQAFETAVRRKVVYDLDALKDIVITMEKLVNQGYARKIGSLKDSDIRSSYKAVDALNKKIEEITPKPYERSSRDKKKDHEENIRAFARVLLDEKGDDSVYGAWEAINKRLRPSYDAWSRHNEELKKRVRENKRKFYDPYKVLDYDEYRFNQTFNLLQALLRRMEGYGSLEF